MSTTDQILGNRDTQFMTSGQPKGMSTRYYTLTDTSKKPPIIQTKTEGQTAQWIFLENKK